MHRIPARLVASVPRMGIFRRAFHRPLPCQGIHKAIWDEIAERPFALPPGKPLTVVAYRAQPVKAAYVEPRAVGDLLPSLPIFLTEEKYVPAPLEETYQASWAAFPAALKPLLELPSS